MRDETLLDIDESFTFRLWSMTLFYSSVDFLELLKQSLFVAMIHDDHFHYWMFSSFVHWLTSRLHSIRSWSVPSTVTKVHERFDSISLLSSRLHWYCYCYWIRQVQFSFSLWIVLHVDIEKRSQLGWTPMRILPHTSVICCAGSSCCRR